MKRLAMTTKNIVDPDGILRSSSEPDEQIEPNIVNGSFYIQLMQALTQTLKDNGDWTWMKNCLTGDILMGSDVQNIVKRLSIVFEQLGLTQGQCIHIVVGNRHYSYLSVFAAWHLGAFTSTGDTELDEDTISGQLEDLKVGKFIICTPELSTKIIKATEKFNSTHNKEMKVVCLGEAQGCLNLFELIQHVDENDAKEPVKVTNPMTENLSIFWSSGTTGKPKGICWSHQGMSNWFFRTSRSASPAQTEMSTQCFFHIGATWGVLSAMIKGSTWCHLNGPGFSLQKLLEAIKKENPASLTIGSHHYVQMSEMDFSQTGLDKQDLSSVIVVTPVGTSVPEISFTKLQNIFPNLKVKLNVYGATEFGPVSYSFCNKHLGAILSGVKVKILNVDSETICQPGELGEICIRSPFTMKEYLERPAENKECFIDDGFLRTGDLGCYSEQGEFMIVDRIKEIIKYQNNHVSPSELESVLQEHPAVKESLVFGKKDPKVQEWISAVVVLNENAKADAEDIRSYVNDRIKIDYKKIRGEILIRDEIPRNSNGKLLRREMRRWAEEQANTCKL